MFTRQARHEGPYVANDRELEKNDSRYAESGCLFETVHRNDTRHPPTLFQSGLVRLFRYAGSGRGFASLAGRGFLARCKHHDHLTAFKFGHCFNLAQFFEIIANALEYPHSQFLVRHLAATETQGYLGFVAVFDKTTQIAQLDLVVTFIGTRPEFDFLDLDDLLLGARFLLAFLFLVLEFAVVHEAANWRCRIGCDFNQIYVVVFSLLDSLGRTDNTQLLAVDTDQTDFGYADFTIDAMGFFGCDV